MEQVGGQAGGRQVGQGEGGCTSVLERCRQCGMLCHHQLQVPEMPQLLRQHLSAPAPLRPTLPSFPAACLPTSLTREVDVVHLGVGQRRVGAQRLRQRQVVVPGQLADALAGGIKHHVHLGWSKGGRGRVGRTPRCVQTGQDAGWWPREAGRQVGWVPVGLAARDTAEVQPSCYLGARGRPPA